ncbi:Uncharacterized protein PBTT_00372 [Plasmodiophora brassicae]
MQQIPTLPLAIVVLALASPLTLSFEMPAPAECDTPQLGIFGQQQGGPPMQAAMSAMGAPGSGVHLLPPAAPMISGRVFASNTGASRRPWQPTHTQQQQQQQQQQNVGQQGQQHDGRPLVQVGTPQTTSTPHDVMARILFWLSKQNLPSPVPLRISADGASCDLLVPFPLIPLEYQQGNSSDQRPTPPGNTTSWPIAVDNGNVNQTMAPVAKSLPPKSATFAPTSPAQAQPASNASDPVSDVVQWLGANASDPAPGQPSANSSAPVSEAVQRLASNMTNGTTPSDGSSNSSSSSSSHSSSSSKRSGKQKHKSSASATLASSSSASDSDAGMNAISKLVEWLGSSLLGQSASGASTSPPAGKTPAPGPASATSSPPNPSTDTPAANSTTSTSN